MAQEAHADITPISQETNIEADDQIANLLIGDDPAADDTDDDVNLSDESTDEGESDDNDDDEGEQDGSDSPESEEDEDATWENVLGVNEEQLVFDEEGNFKGFKTKVNGEAGTVSTEDLIANHQLSKVITNKSKALAEDRKTFDSEKETFTSTYKTKLQTVDLLANHLEKQIIGDFNKVNWEELRISDPAEYAAMRQDFSAKALQMQQVKDAIGTDRSKQTEEETAKAAGLKDAYVSEQVEKIVTNNPTWADEKVRTAKMGEFKDFVTEKYGFTPEEFDSTLDSRLVELMKDAKQFHEGKKVAAKKVVKKVPGFQKSSRSPKGRNSKLDRLTRASKKAKGVQKRDLQTSAIAELLT